MIDAVVLGLLAIGDLAFLAYLRRRRKRAERVERIQRSLEFAVRRELGSKRQPGPLRELRTPQ